MFSLNFDEFGLGFIWAKFFQPYRSPSTQDFCFARYVASPTIIKAVTLTDCFNGSIWASAMGQWLRAW